MITRFDLLCVLYGAPDETRAFLESLLVLDDQPGWNLWVLDNSPDDDAWRVFHDMTAREHPGAFRSVHYRRDRSNPGYPVGMNRLAQLGDAEFLAMLNPDAAFLEPDTLAKIAFMFDDEPDVAIQGPRQCDSAGNLIHSGWGWLPDGSGQAHRHSMQPGEYRDVIDSEMVTGSSLWCRRTVWNELADCENYRKACPDAEGPCGTFQHFFDDSLLCGHAFEHGHKIVYRGDIDMIHECSRSASPDSDYIRRAWAESRPEFDRVMHEMGIPTWRTEKSLS